MSKEKCWVFVDKDGTEKISNSRPIRRQFKGKRIKRGLYRSKNGTLINADVNGSYNIVRKVAPNLFKDGVESVVLHPYKISIV